MIRTPRTALLALCLLLGGCTYWKEPIAAPRYALSEHQSRVRIVLRDSTRVEMSRAVLFRDSLSGVANGRRTLVAVSDIAYVQYRRPGHVQTEGVAGVVTVFAVTVAILGALLLLVGSE